MDRRNIRLAAALLFGASTLAACGQAEVGASPSPTEVAVATAEVATVIPMDDLPGRVVAFRTAEIRPQVSGVVTRRLFDQGSEVHAGQPLFQIDPAPYQAEAEGAQAALSRAVVVADRAKAQVSRLAPLVESDAISRQSYDDAVAAKAQAEADLAEARATLRRRGARPALRPLAQALALLGLGAAALPALAQAQQPQVQTTLEKVEVTGTRIKRLEAETASAVQVITRDDIAQSGALSVADVLRDIPAGNVGGLSSDGPADNTFGASGISLRGLGVGNTLVLLNGRRVATWPGTQADSNLAPVLTTNSNTLPVSGIQRLEVLRDGAAALYGADAVAGVLNTVLRDDLDGGTVSVRYGGAEGTGLRDFNLKIGRAHV